MSEYFTFAGTDCRTYGVYAFESDTFGAPARALTPMEIPGRNGSLLIDGNRYADQVHEYNCVIYQNFEANLRDFRNFLMSKVGYQELTDSMHADEKYLAYYGQDFITMMKPDRGMGHFTLSFTRKPQRYLTGVSDVELTANGSITNPTLFPSQPLLRVWGTGRVGIGSNSILITTANEYTDIDCELMEAYKGTVSCNNYIQIQDIDFPVLKPGANGITLGTGITKVKITPRWYRL